MTEYFGPCYKRKKCCSPHFAAAIILIVKQNPYYPTSLKNATCNSTPRDKKKRVEVGGYKYHNASAYSRQNSVSGPIIKCQTTTTAIKTGLVCVGLFCFQLSHHVWGNSISLISAV
jgi:hypothetical protein